MMEVDGETRDAHVEEGELLVDTQMNDLRVPQSAHPLGQKTTYDYIPFRKNFIHEQTKVYLKTENGGFREYIIKLFGPDIYFYTDDKQSVHDFMHTLVGTFISLDVPKDDAANNRQVFPIKIAMPPRFSRRIYFGDKKI